MRSSSSPRSVAARTATTFALLWTLGCGWTPEPEQKGSGFDAGGAPSGSPDAGAGGVPGAGGSQGGGFPAGGETPPAGGDPSGGSAAGGAPAGGDQPLPVGGEPAGDASASLDAGLPSDALVVDEGVACDGALTLPDAGDGGTGADAASDTGVAAEDAEVADGADGALGHTDGALPGLDCQRP
ncbi:MAG: hypothetical protein ACOYM9_18840 [Bradymonadia bacterium]